MLDRTEICVILDRSGSMESIREDVIGGFNSFIDAQKKLAGRCSVSLIQFDNQYEEIYLNKHIRTVPNLNTNTFVPRGSTALLDAVGRAINNLGAKLSSLPLSERPTKVIVAIITDGMENASHEFNLSKISEMIKHQTEKYNWQFTYLGANVDAFANSDQLNINQCAGFNYQSTKVGTQHMFQALNNATESYRTNKSACMSYTDEDRK